MPRTKQRRAGRRTSAECEQAIRDFNRLVQLKIHQIELEHKTMQQKFDAAIEMSLARFPKEIQNMTLRELLTKDLSSPTKENLPPKTPRTDAKSRLPRSTTTARTTKRTTAASDDGYQSHESMSSQASKLGPVTAKKRNSRSCSRDPSRDRVSRARSASRDRQSRLATVQTKKKKKESMAVVQKDLLKTPSLRPDNAFVITPKIKFNSAVNVLRKPKDGEMVFSTQGSPLLVSTTVNDRTANVNVPLQNGNVMSLLPFNDSSLTEQLTLDDETKHQLRILQSHLAKVLK